MNSRHDLQRLPSAIYLAFCLAIGLAARVGAETDNTGGGAEAAAQKEGLPRPQDALWIVSTRGANCCGKNGLNVYRFSQSCWNDSDPSDLYASLDRSGCVVVYVHGNRMDFSDAAGRGLRYYRELATPDSPPIQFVIWSWPSQRVPGPVRDIRTKAARADCDAELFAEFLTSMRPSTPLSLIGYSYGTRVISGGLAKVAERQASAPMAQAVFLAPALDVNWLAPDQYHAAAWQRMHRLLIFYNSLDPALKRFRFVTCSGNPAALGFVGAWWRGQTPGSVDDEDVRCIVGKSHSEVLYLNSWHIAERLRGFLQLPLSGNYLGESMDEGSNDDELSASETEPPSDPQRGADVETAAKTEPVGITGLAFTAWLSEDAVELE